MQELDCRFNNPRRRRNVPPLLHAIQQFAEFRTLGIEHVMAEFIDPYVGTRECVDI